MNKIRTILLDALILFAVSTVFVALADRAFSGLKGKVPKDDPVVTAIGQGELSGLEAAIKELEKDPKYSVATQTDEHRRTSLMRAAYANLDDPAKLKKADETRAPMVTLLLAKGSLIDAVDRDGWSALMWAAWSGMPMVANELLNRGANPGLADHHGNTALIIAAQRGQLEIIKALLAKGADKTATTKSGLTAAAAAATGKRLHADQAETFDAILAVLQ